MMMMMTMLAMIMYVTITVEDVGRMDIDRDRQNSEVVEAYFAREDNYMTWVVYCTKRMSYQATFGDFVVDKQRDLQTLAGKKQGSSCVC